MLSHSRQWTSQVIPQSVMCFQHWGWMRLVCLILAQRQRCSCRVKSKNPKSRKKQLVPELDQSWSCRKIQQLLLPPSIR